MGNIPRLVGGIVGVLIILLGGIWILQGINILPGSFMTGHIQWAIAGVIVAMVGVILIVLSNRKGPAG